MRPGWSAKIAQHNNQLLLMHVVATALNSEAFPGSSSALQRVICHSACLRGRPAEHPKGLAILSGSQQPVCAIL